MIGLALQECKKMGIDRVLMSCDPDNIGSKKSIMNNGGVFEDEIISKYGGERLERYWIDNK
jgi:predicted acetyltransferase